MSAILRHLICRRSAAFLSNTEHNVVQSRTAAKQRHFVRRPPPLPNVSYQALGASLKQKGYLRAQSPYTPPPHVSHIIDKVKATANCTTGTHENVFSLDDKFKFLMLCSAEFKHTVPSSVLHEMNTFDDVIDFYETPINTYFPLDEMQTRPLPPNLHIQNNYVRFHPDTDTMFKGVSAFPQSSTLVTGIRARKAYPGYKHKPTEMSRTEKY